MLNSGLTEEVERLYSRGDLNRNLPSVRAVGYRQVWDWLDGGCDYETMVERSVIATRRLVKRQLTWLRRETELVVFSSDKTGSSEIFQAISQHLG